MEKLIVKFEINHPMSVCALSFEQRIILNKAMEMRV